MEQTSTRPGPAVVAETPTTHRPGPAVVAETPTTHSHLATGLFLSETRSGVTWAVPPYPIEIEGNKVTIWPPSMEVGLPYRFIFKGAELIAIRRSFGVDVYVLEQSTDDKAGRTETVHAAADGRVRR